MEVFGQIGLKAVDCDMKVDHYVVHSIKCFIHEC